VYIYVEVADVNSAPVSYFVSCLCMLFCYLLGSIRAVDSLAHSSCAVARLMAHYLAIWVVIGYLVQLLIN
jgi:hypothetical protein